MAIASDPSAWRIFRRAGTSTRQVGRPWKAEKLNTTWHGGPTCRGIRSHGALVSAPFFKPIRNNRRGTTDTALTAGGVYQILNFYGKKVGISVDSFGPHSARTTAAANALDQGADVAKIQEWLGHANVSTTRVYDYRKTRREGSPVFKIYY
jgi:integrase